jgi:ABC-type transport system involved in Fe-S cluster assembly fused permease/ATPase subunit
VVFVGRYRAVLDKWNEANLKSQWTLAGLNSGQAFIVSISCYFLFCSLFSLWSILFFNQNGLMILKHNLVVVVMVLAAFEVKNGTMTLGDFVLVNTFLLQLYTPLNLVANTYRITKTALVRSSNLSYLICVCLLACLTFCLFVCLG